MKMQVLLAPPAAIQPSSVGIERHAAASQKLRAEFHMHWVLVAHEAEVRVGQRVTQFEPSITHVGFEEQAAVAGIFMQPLFKHESDAGSHAQSLSALHVVRDQ